VNRFIAWPEVLVLAFATGWCARLAFGRDATAIPTEIRRPATILAVLILASAFVQVSVTIQPLGGVDGGRALWTFFTRDYFLAWSQFPALRAAFLLLEGLLLLLAATSLVATAPRLLVPMAAGAVAGGALAAAANVAQLIEAAAGTADFWRTLAAHLSGVRVNVHYGDLNAAGSHFAMLAFVAVALAIRQGTTARAWIVPALMISAAMWLTGSRAAVVACPIAIVGVLLVRAVHAQGIRGIAWVAAPVLLAAAAAAVVYSPTRGGQPASSIALRIRLELAATAGRMVRERPVFGIGLGQFLQRSGEFSSDELLRMYPPARRENAHNNFLQILAELGVAGLAAFLWVLTAASRSLYREPNVMPGRTVIWGCAGGLIAFLVSCLGGHPLLVREPAYTFWLLLGVVAGSTWGRGGESSAAIGPSRQTRGRDLLVAAAIVVIVISIPLRVLQARAGADLEHRGIGLSLWHTAADGVRYRAAVGPASVFVPADRAFRFRIASTAAHPVRVALMLDGRTADVVHVEPGRWKDVTILRRSVDPGARFVRLDLEVLDTEEPVELRITKIEPAGSQP
jgi:O-antigen ligase